MKKVALPVILALISIAASAQTIYTQTADQFCTSSDYVCNQIPFSGGVKFNFVDGSRTLTVGTFVTFYANGVVSFGAITAVEDAPPVEIGNDGPVVFTWTAGSFSGLFTGYVEMIRQCGRYCYPHPLLKAVDPEGIESTLKVN